MKKIKLNIYAKIIIPEILVIFLMSFLVPVLLNYPPNSESVEFQSQIEPISHAMQYLALGSLGVIIYIIVIKIFFKDIFKFLKHFPSKMSHEDIKKIRIQCFKIPLKIVVVQVCLLIFILCILFTAMDADVKLCFKFLLVYFSFFIMIAVISNILLKKDLDYILNSTYEIDPVYSDTQTNSKFYKNLLYNLLPFFIVTVITIALLGYAKVSNALGESNYYYYKLYFNNINTNGTSLPQLVNDLNSIPLKSNDDYYFILTDNIDICSSSKGEVSDFFIKYANTYIDNTNGRVYEYYGVEEEGYVQKLILDDGEVGYVGFKYPTTTYELSTFFILITIIAITSYILILILWSKNVSKNIIEVSNSLSMIAKNNNVFDFHIIPVISTDEIGALTIAFNDIQKLTKNNIKQIEDNQSMLMEKERLASLGQMIGGIAHNLKTPIMSIAGAAEGLTDLTKEYDISIGDPSVTNEDHHAIVKDMNEWIEKVKTHASYMSDVITAVKGQAVAFADTKSDTFTISELLTHVDVLMKHELKNALVYLNTSVLVPETLSIKGNINSLVQVINNIISNAIQAYGGKTNKNIDFIIKLKNNSLVFSIQDYGCGMPKKVQDKLFKEMITTKGKNGTGLGLFMSYSNIRAHFNGNMSFESEEGKGTRFDITIPLN